MCPPSYLERLTATLKPAIDLRQRAAFLPNLKWSELWKMLPENVSELKYAAKARTGKGFQVKLASLASRIQILQQAMHIQDAAKATKVDGMWPWDHNYTQATHKVRTELFAWHIFAVSARQLTIEWEIDTNKSLAIHCTLFDRLGFQLKVRWDLPPTIPDIHNQSFKEHLQ